MLSNFLLFQTDPLLFQIGSLPFFFFLDRFSFCSGACRGDKAQRWEQGHPPQLALCECGFAMPQCTRGLAVLTRNSVWGRVSLVASFSLAEPGASERAAENCLTSSPLPPASQGGRCCHHSPPYFHVLCTLPITPKLPVHLFILGFQGKDITARAISL